MKNILVLNYEYPPLWWWSGRVTKDLSKTIKANYSDYIKMDLFTSSFQDINKKIIDSSFENIYTVKTIRKNQHSLGIIWFITFLWNWFFELRKILKKNKYDLIHYHCSVPSAFLAVTHFFRIPYIITQHWVDVPFFIKNENIIFQIILFIPNLIILNKAKNIVTVSKNLEKQQKKFLINKDKVITIHNSTDLDFFKFHEKQELWDKKILTFVWRFDKFKRIDRLFELGKILYESWINFEINIIGSWKMYSFYKKNIQKEKIKYIKLHWIQDNIYIYEMLKNSHHFIILSDYESFWLVILEAIASWTPIIMTKKWGLGDFIENHNFWKVFDLTNSIKWYLDIKKYIIESNINKLQWNILEKYDKIESWEEISRKYFNLFYKD